MTNQKMAAYTSLKKTGLAPPISVNFNKKPVNYKI